MRDITHRTHGADTFDGALDQMASIQKVYETPSDLTEAEGAMFQLFLRGRENKTWSDSDLQMLAQLVKQYTAVEELRALIALHGYIMPTENGFATNPAARLVTTSLASISMMSRVLGISASQRGVGQDKEQSKRTQAEAAMREAMERVKGDSLI
jgi:phage terminase small subunit